MANPAIPGQTRCEHCAERHRISCKTYDRRRRAPTEQHNEGLLGEPTVPDAPSNAISQTAKRTNEPPPKPVTGTTKPPNRREYDRLRNQRPERKEFHRRHAQEQRQRAKESGLCRHCGNAAIPSQIRCERCAERHRQSCRRGDARQKTAGKQTTT